MEAHKFYELEKLLEGFQNYMEFSKDEVVKTSISRTIEIVQKEITDYEVDKKESIRQDIENDKPSDGDQE